jgi:hypothetical protein
VSDWKKRVVFFQKIVSRIWDKFLSQFNSLFLADINLKGLFLKYPIICLEALYFTASKTLTVEITVKITVILGYYK